MSVETPVEKTAKPRRSRAKKAVAEPVEPVETVEEPKDVSDMSVDTSSRTPDAKAPAKRSRDRVRAAPVSVTTSTAIANLAYMEKYAPTDQAANFWGKKLRMAATSHA